jgi:hypothetical protein
MYTVPYNMNFLHSNSNTLYQPHSVKSCRIHPTSKFKITNLLSFQIACYFRALLSATKRKIIIQVAQVILSSFKKIEIPQQVLIPYTDETQQQMTKHQQHPCGKS